MITTGWSGEGGGGGGGDAVWRGCSSSGPRTPITPVLSLPLRPHPDTGHRPVAEQKHEDTKSSENLRVIILYYYSILILQTDWQYSAIQLVCHLLPNLRRNKLEGRRKMLLKV